jgi:hypothetical protein
MSEAYNNYKVAIDVAEKISQNYTSQRSNNLSILSQFFPPIDGKVTRQEFQDLLNAFGNLDRRSTQLPIEQSVRSEYLRTIINNRPDDYEAIKAVHAAMRGDISTGTGLQLFNELAAPGDRDILSYEDIDQMNNSRKE